MPYLGVAPNPRENREVDDISSSFNGSTTAFTLQSGNIIPNNRIQAPNQVSNKVANINFNISTVDARGFDQLLQSRRGQIVTIVNQAMNDRGTRGVA